MKKKDLPAQKVHQCKTPTINLHPYQMAEWDGQVLIGYPVFLPFRSTPRPNTALQDLLNRFRQSTNSRFRNRAGLLNETPPPLFANCLARLHLPAPSDYAAGVFLIPPRIKRANNN